MSTAKKTVYAVVGAGSKAIDEARTLPKRAASLPGIVTGTVTGTAHAVAGKAVSLPDLVRGAGSLITRLPKRAVTLPGKAAGLPKKAASLPSRASELPKQAFALSRKAGTLAAGAAGKARSVAGETVKDARKRWEGYADLGRKVLSQNGSGSKAAAKKPAKPKTSKASKVSKEAPSASSPATEAGTTPQIL